MLSHLASSHRTEITETSVAKLDKKAAHFNSFWLPFLGSSL